MMHPKDMPFLDMGFDKISLQAVPPIEQISFPPLLKVISSKWRIVLEPLHSLNFY